MTYLKNSRLHLIAIGLAVTLCGCDQQEQQEPAPPAAQVQEQPTKENTSAPAPADEKKAHIPITLAPYHARGNEPAWDMTSEGEKLVLKTDHGKNIINATPIGDTQAGTTRIITAHSEAGMIHAAINTTPCLNNMSGERYADQVTVTLNGQTLSGCGGENLIREVVWRLRAINDEPLPEDTQASIFLGSDGRIGGNSGCNVYSGQYTLEDGVLNVSENLVMTRRACVDSALMALEQRLMQLLPEMTSLSYNSDDYLLIMTKGGIALRFARDKEQTQGQP